MTVPRLDLKAALAGQPPLSGIHRKQNLTIILVVHTYMPNSLWLSFQGKLRVGIIRPFTSQ